MLENASSAKQLKTTWPWSLVSSGSIALNSALTLACDLLMLGTGLDSAMGVTTLWNMACLHDDLRDGVMNSGVRGVRGVLSKLIALQ